MFIIKTTDKHTYKGELISKQLGFVVPRPRCTIIIPMQEVVSYSSLSPERGEVIERRRTRRAGSWYRVKAEV